MEAAITSQSISLKLRILTVLSELVSHIIELYDLSWAHKGEIKRIGKENNIFALIVLERDLLELINVPRHTLEMRSRMLNASLHWVVEGGGESGSLANCEDEVVALKGNGSKVVLEERKLVKGLHYKSILFLL
jgi:hypothetical protein